MGTGPAAVGKPCPRSARKRTTPSAAASPKADPPDSTTASTRSTSREGSSSAVSRVAGAPPRTSPEPTVPAGAHTTVTPVSGPVQWPTRMPATSVMALTAPAWRAGRAPSHLAQIAAGNPVADAAAHLIGDRPELRRPLGRRDGVLPLPAEEHDLGADLDAGGGVAVARPEVDEQLVHGDRPGDGPASPADEHLAAHLAEPAGDTVGVADRHGHHGRGDVEAVAQAVGQPLSGHQPPHIADPGLEAEGGLQRKAPVQLG